MSKRITSLYIVIMYCIFILLTLTGFFHYLIGIQQTSIDGISLTNGTTLTLSLGFGMWFVINLFMKE